MREWFTGAGRRRRAARRLPEGPLRHYLETPPPGPSTPLGELPLLAVDVETTGLEPRRDRVLSVGSVPVDGDRIVLGGAESMLLRGAHAEDDDGVGQSATLHGITDDTVATGVGGDVFLDRILGALAGRVLVAHYSRIETDFLASLCFLHHGVRPTFVAVDTLELHRRVLGAGIDRGFAPESSPDRLRLWSARERYGLPRYRAHDALVDALACAELYLAQTAELHDRGVRTLRDLRTT
ncbi:exonuclease domain-containing protein [Dietzia sp. PP-33]|jgi:DNA polymerase-3 subunit epsilon|uniref:exonuclease domain-containing protein n=1 Tax=Dietzia sp. PP-33 TaxID=2957500 RepID=UPI0029ABFB00|nr:exonuclease domain-containing protein [Dietzia sp. PP-33]MDX2355680.1 exonuclease domain-containing protein [Dietzia sp. PP-33]